VLQNKDGEQKSFNQSGLFSLLILTAFSSANAGDFADFKRVQNAAFSEYKDKKDTAFESYLKSQWSEYKAFTSPALYKEPKPKVILPASKREVLSRGPNIFLNIAKSPKEQSRVPLVVTKKGTLVEYFGSSLHFSVDMKIKNARFYPQNRDGIINAFSIFASSDSDALLYEIKNVCKELGLNDWGLYLLVQKIANKTFNDLDDRKLFSWFLLNKLGYDTKVGIKDEHILLLSRTKQLIYASSKYTINSKPYYLLSANRQKGSIYTYSKNYPNAVKALDFSLRKLPMLAQRDESKTRRFSFLGKQYSISYHYNKNLIDFMRTYPQVSYEVYFNAPLQEQTYRDIALDIKPYLDGKKMNFGINFILRFVQTAFGYERDQEQFGKEKVMFAQETLYYDKSDCEDRATLYAVLIKKLFGISVVGVKYSNHIATALYIPLQGDSVKVKGRRYVVADPTYINANVGESMPKYRSIIPENFIYLR